MAFDRAAGARRTVHPNPVHLMMKSTVLMVLAGILLVASQAVAQQKTVTGKVTSEQGAPVAGGSITVKRANTRTSSNSAGEDSIRAEGGPVLQVRVIRNALVRPAIGAERLL